MLRFLALLLGLGAAPLAAQQAEQPLEVDIELFLAVDVSRSMSPFELELQRRGYAEALTHPDVISAIRGGLIGQIALTYVEWAGTTSQTVIVPWTLVDSAATAAEVAETLSITRTDSMRRTSISGAMYFATDSIASNSFRGLRRVIDISGDGPNNQGLPVLDARAAVLDQGITINGLPLMTDDEFSSRWGIEDLDIYYSECVIGGPGAFVIPVHDWIAFPEAIRRKLVLEIAGLEDAELQEVHKAQAYDCMIGEKIWKKNFGGFFSP